MQAEPIDPRLVMLSELVQLQSRARALGSLNELAFFMVNETHRLLPYRQALLWETGSTRLRAASGIQAPDHHAPFCQEMVRLCQRWQQNHGQPQRLESRDLEATDRAFWQEYLPEHGLWLPLNANVTLLLWRETPWRDEELRLLQELAGAYGHCWQSLQPQHRLRPPRLTRKRSLVLAAALIAVLFIPVRQSVIAPAFVAARHPALLRAPLSGVIDQVVVQPNQAVKKGEVLVRLDARELQNQLERARQQFASSDAEFRQAQQQALSDDDAKAQLAVLSSRRESSRADVSYLQAQLARSELTAPRDGIALFDDVSDLVGKTVSPGERIMQLADPHETELDIELPAADAIALQPGAQVRLFLNVAPDSSHAATLEQIGWRAALTPDNIMAYHLRARFDKPDALQQIGLKGSAKIYGERTLLGAWLLRKPWAALRVWLGVW
ncbi:efflux RND transporter periplasmic adaptor subunit [Pantoea sp. A4]|uniref:efflux RND transporter periplasmic adaptor subunit n=1 Tax=Pantoea sp. A4 TaxID=1225184 RepID=UPI00036A3AB2|nr:HlyD family efflux transporter periplasmic adaptor subunit [Pantoea sp. A4]